MQTGHRKESQFTEDLKKGGKYNKIGRVGAYLIIQIQVVQRR